jgi:RNA-binding protein
MAARGLTSAERRALRARSHALHPVVMIGSAGLTAAVLKEIGLALKSHDLIKIRMLGDDRAAREQALEQVCAALEASPVQLIGKVLVVYRPTPEPEKDTEPTSRKKPARRNKRSHQHPVRRKR